MGRRPIPVALAAMLAAAILLPAAASAAAPPRVVQLNYFVRDDGNLPHTRLAANVRRADSVGFSTVFKGKHASAPGRFDDNISGHPWVVQHQSRGGKVYKLIRRSLHRRGSASVRIRARNGSGVDRVKLKIRVSDCTKDPPFYPLDCTIHR